MRTYLQIFLVGSLLLTGNSTFAQCPTIVCPNDTMVMNDPGICEAIVNYSDPVFEDTCTGGPGSILVVSDLIGSAPEIAPLLTSEGYTVTFVDGDFAAGDNPTLQGVIDDYGLIVWHAVGGGYGDVHNATTFVNLTNYVNNGGAVLVHGYDIIASPTDQEMINFLGGTSSVDVPGNGGLGTIAGPANSLTDGVTNIVGLTLNNGGDHDALVTLTGGTVGVSPNASGWDWALRTLGSGEIAWMSTGQSGTNASAIWNTPGSGYQEGLLNFAFNHSTPQPILTMISGYSSGSSFPIGATTITYEVTDSQGGNAQQCSFNVTVVNDIDTNVSQNGQMLNATPQLATYQWLDCSNNYAVINGEVNQSYDASAGANVAVEITNEDGCVDTSNCYIVSGVGLDELESSAISIYPNPSNGKFTIEASQLMDKVLIYEVTGRIVYVQSQLNTNRIDLDLSKEHPGVYYIELLGESGTFRNKIIVNK